MTKNMTFSPNEPEPSRKPATVLNQTVAGWENPTKKRQYMVAGAAGVLYLAGGTTLGWFFALDSHSLLEVSHSDLAWVQALLFLGAAIGTIPGDLLADCLGRKLVLLMMAVAFLVGWVLIAVATTAPVCIGRFLQGLATGAVFRVVPVYISETAEATLWPTFQNMLFKIILVGFLLSFFIGQMIPYIVLALLSALIPIVYIVAFHFLPESPIYLLIKQRPEQARLTLQWLRQQPPEQLQPEFEVLQVAAQELNNSYRELAGTPDLVRALLVMLVLVIFQQMSGICLELSYKSTIFRSFGSNMLVAISAIIAFCIIFLASYFQKRIEARIGRKRLLFFSAIGMACSQALVAIFFSVGISALAFLGIIGVFGYLAMFFVGFGPIPFQFTKDSFPIKLLNKAVSVFLTLTWFMVFFIAAVFWTIQAHVTFWIFAVSCAFAAVVVHFIIPDTKDNPVLVFKDEEQPDVPIV